MSTNQELRHISVRAVTGTTRDYNSDWMALFDSLSIAQGPFNQRMLSYINLKLGVTYTNLSNAMQALAANQGFTNWASMGIFTASAFSLTAPVLAWTTAASDNTPGFSVSGDSLDVAPVGAQIEIQVSTDVGFTPPPADTELAAVSGNPVAIDVSPALSDGQYWARARLLDSGDVALTDWSNVENKTISSARQFAMFSPIYGGMFVNSSGTRQSPVGGTFFNEGNL